MKHFILILALLAGSLHATAGHPVRVIITAGQSNTDGRVLNERLPHYIKAMAKDSTAAEGAYRYCRIAQNDAQGKFIPFWPRSTKGNNYNKWGYDAVTYYWLEQLLQEEFYVIKWAVGGTSIAPDYNAEKGRYWSADAQWLSQTEATSKGGKSLLLSFIQEIDVCIDQTLSKLENGYQIEAFLWHQGESDQHRGKEYYDNLKKLVNYVRTYLSKKTGRDYSKLPFVFGTVARVNKSYNSDVEAGMKRLAAEDPNAYLIDMSGAELQSDGLHFTEKSAEYLGRRVYERLEALISEQ